MLIVAQNILARVRKSRYQYKFGNQSVFVRSCAVKWFELKLHQTEVHSRHKIQVTVDSLQFE